MEKSYHHGNLKEELIKKGIELINEVGENKLSLRKLAIICGVSNSAPYTHFKSKDELLKEMSFYIFNLLKLELENTRKKYNNKENLLVMLGKTYVIFFLKNPKYYYFLSSRKDIEIDLSLKIDNNILFNLDVFCYFNNLDNVVVRLNIIKENNNFNTKEIISNKYYICKSMIFIDFVRNLGKEYILNE